MLSQHDLSSSLQSLLKVHIVAAHLYNFSISVSGGRDRRLPRSLEGSYPVTGSRKRQRTPASNTLEAKGLLLRLLSDYHMCAMANEYLHSHELTHTHVDTCMSTQCTCSHVHTKAFFKILKIYPYMYIMHPYIWHWIWMNKPLSE